MGNLICNRPIANLCIHFECKFSGNSCPGPHCVQLNCKKKKKSDTHLSLLVNRRQNFSNFCSFAKCFLIPDEFASVEEAVAPHLGFFTRLDIFSKGKLNSFWFLLILLIKHVTLIMVLVAVIRKAIVL